MSNAYQAYGARQSQAMGGRMGEAHAFTEAARLLHDARTAGDRAAAVKALKNNLNLWTQLQAELSQPDHKMSDGLRTNLLQLSVFVDKRTMEALADPNPDLLEALVEINRQVAQGQMAATETTPAP